HCPAGLKNPKFGAVTVPPSINAGYCDTPISPPQVRFPISGPVFVYRNIHGIMSPPEPAISFTIITFGPRIDAADVRYIAPYRGLHHPSSGRFSTSIT